MKFLHPEFLFGLLAVAIPVIIHLFNFRKAKKIYFSNTRFIQEVKKSTSSKRRLKHLLILFSRILFITFLVLAFAQPIIPSKSGMQGSENVYIYIDNSLSMTNTTSEGNRGLDIGLGTVEKLIDIYPANTNYKILTNDFAPFSNTLKSRDEVSELLTEIRRSDVSRSFQELYNRLNTNVLGSESDSREIYYISDFQKSTFGSEHLNPDTANPVFLIPIRLENYSNVFIDTVYLENPFLMGDESNMLHVVIKNSGEDDVDELSIKFYMNDIQNSSSSLNIEGNSSYNYSIDLSMPLEKINRVRLDFEEFPVSFDNEYYLILNKSDRINVLEIKSETKSTTIEKVFGNQAIFNFKTQHISNIDYSLINQSDLVILNGLNEVEQSLEDVIKSYHANGGSVLLIPGEHPDIISYQNLATVRIKPSLELGKLELKEPTMANPFFDKIFESTEKNIQMPSVLPVIQWSEERKSLLEIKSGQSYLSEVKPKFYLLAAPLTDEYSTFQKHALFVPVMYRLASMSKEVSNELSYKVSDNLIDLKLDSLNRKSVYKLRSDENEYIPGQRVSGDHLLMDLPKYTLHNGFYDLYADDNYLTTLAINIDKRESMLDTYSVENLKELFSDYKNVSIFDVLNSKKAEKEIKKIKFGTPLWKYALILSLLFLLSEVLLIRFFK